MKILLDISVLRRNRNFRFLYTGQFISFIGTMISQVALPYQIYHITQSTLMVGLLSLCQLLPLLITSLLGGVITDRYHRRQLLLIAESILALGCLILIINANLPHPHIWILFAVATFTSGFTGLHYPALDGIIQQIVHKEDFSSIGSLNAFMYSTAMIAGPTIGGLIIAHFGLSTAYSIDFLSFLASLATISILSDIPKPTANLELSIWSSLKEGLRFAMSRQELLGTYIVDFVAMVFGMPIALFPAIAQSLGGPKILGLLYAAPAVGSLLISLFSNWTKAIKRQGLAIALAAASWGVAIICFGLTKNLLLVLFFLACAGCFDFISGMLRGILWNETIPNELRGRLSGIGILLCISGPKLGDAEAGFVAAAFGVTASIISGGILCIIGVAACCYIMPKFINYKRSTRV